MTPEEQEAVRRALASTPPEGPMPPELVARLEATIADLAAVRAAEQAGPGTAAPVSDLEARRRRRWPRVLVAAASVVLVGYGVGVVLEDVGPTAETAMSGSAADDAGADGEVESEAGGGAAPQEAAPPGDPGAPGLLADGAVAELSEATLRRDVVRHLERGRVAAQSDGRTDSSEELDAKRYASRDGACALPDLGSGDDVFAARLDGRRATLVVRAARDGTRVAEVYSCGEAGTPLARTDVPARR